jgi:Flp pilus assembly CpaE family ATPase
MVVANRGGGDQQAMRLPDFQKALGRKVDVLIPEESKAFNEAANTGKPLVHFAARSKAAKILQKLAGDILGKKTKARGAKAAGPKKPWLSLGKRSKA